jgi:hypothetical protein
LASRDTFMNLSNRTRPLFRRMTSFSVPAG